MADKEECSNCRFVHSYNVDQERRHVCRRNPPAANRYERAHFPRVETRDWCGEWQPDNTLCPRCDGHGKVVDDAVKITAKTCPVCGGDGKMPADGR